MFTDLKKVIILLIDKEVLHIIEINKVMLTKCLYHQVIQAVNMINHVMSIFGAIVLTFVVIYLAHEWDIPRRFFYHGLECSGAIGGGCL
jgi:hypothetical protein